MKLKHLLFALSSFTVTGLAVAQADMPAENPNLLYGLYAAVNLGYVNIPYQHRIGGITTNDQTPANATLSWKNGNGGFVWGGDLGYQFNRNLAFEMGALRYPIATATLTASNTQFNRFSSWNIYGAMRFIAPVFNQFAIFAKAGATYYIMHAHPLNNSAWKNDNQFTPLFAAGASYAFPNSIMLDITYTHLGGNFTPTITLPSANAITGGIGYKFES